MRRRGIGAALAAVVGAGVGAALLVAPGATAQAVLPPVSPEALVASVITAHPAPFAGTVTIDNALGLPALPGAPQAANGTSTARVWSGGDGKKRVALPSPTGERTLISDGTTRWSYDSTDRTAVRAPQDGSGGPGGPGTPGDQPGPGGLPPGTPDPQTDPAGAASALIGKLRQTSTVTVDGTAEVAGRSAYQLVLRPLPSERTLLREVRVAVDGEQRLPLQLTVLSNGSPDPALRAGFSELTFGQQDPSLFTFTPPPGTTVRDAPARGDGDHRGGPEGSRVVGDGWDTVIVGNRPAAQPGQPAQPGRPAQPGQPGQPSPAPAPGAPQGGPPPSGGPGRNGGPDLSALANVGRPVSGPWGTGRVINTAVATAIVTDDGRFAVGAVPEQVLDEALTR